VTELAEITCTAEELGALAGVSARHIRRLGLPKAGRNCYLLTDAIPALIEALTGGDAGAELTMERVRLTKAQANRAELEFAKARGEVALIDDFRRAQEKVMGAIRANIMQVPARAVLQLLGEGDETTFKAKLRAELTAALVRSAQVDIDLDEDDDALSDGEPQE